VFYYFTTFAPIFYFPAETLAIECLQCYQELKFESSEVFNTTRSECTKKSQVGDMCLASLSIDFGDKTATAYFSHVPDQALLFTNGNKIIIDAMTIWFNKNITTQSFQSFDIDTAAGVEELNKTYNKSKLNKYKHKIYFSTFFFRGKFQT